jgi:hypothetical protein
MPFPSCTGVGPRLRVVRVDRTEGGAVILSLLSTRVRRAAGAGACRNERRGPNAPSSFSSARASSASPPGPASGSVCWRWGQ